MEKTCIKCKDKKDIELFVKTRNLCKECMKEYKKSYHSQNKEKISEYKKESYISKKDEILEKRKKHYENNRDTKLEYQKEYASLNKEKISKYKMEYQRNRRKTDPVFKLKYVVSRIIRNSLMCKGLSKNKRTTDVLGCDISFLKTYLEERFIDDMCWENYGVVWDIDHIIPLATATTEEEVLKLNHYTNLQPLDSYINRNIKRDRLDY
jgi:hypothetical protein